MTPEQLYTIVGSSVGSILIVGLALAGLLMHLAGRITRVEDRLGSVEREQARTSGLLEGLGLTGRADPAPTTAVGD